ncbi:MULTISPECIES: SigE family RNA polymerase sigma factor [unclassified Micromonospora]|uniref:SigE family RNA polymerase sigma factor n=1 Tax=unclassified Micromonospora TaxID=2617518 RepID=UPI002FF23E6D
MGIGSGPDVDESFAAFVATRSGRLVAHAYLLCGDTEQARDIVQGVLVRAYRRWGRIERDDPYAYVAAAVANAVTDWWRIAHRRYETPTAAVPEKAGAAAFGAVDDRQALLAALRHLTRRERAVIVLRYLDDRTEADVAHMLQMRVGTVKATCHRALRKMRRELQDSPLDGLRTAARQGSQNR